MSSVVLDASAGVEIALRTLPGRRFEKRLADHRVFVPEIFYSEVAGVLRRKPHETKSPSSGQRRH